MKQLPVPLEHVEQCNVITWTEYQRTKWPELDLLYAVPNGGHRLKAVAGKMRAEGLKPGVPDLVLPVARGGYFGMYIEMKRQRGTGLTGDQPWWRDQLIVQGYHWVMCRGASAAYDAISEYLSAAPTDVQWNRVVFRGKL